VRACCLRELHRGCPDRTGGAVHDDPRSRTEVGRGQARARDACAVRECRSLLEGQARRLVRQGALLAHADVLRVRA
jgi:hypothetical protein